MEGGSIFCAADDDQAIYGWRGADRDNVVRFMRDFPQAQIIRMAQSYRCSPHILASALPLLAHTRRLIDKSAFSNVPTASSPRVLVHGFWDSAQESTFVCAQIQKLHATGDRFHSMAVLVRNRVQLDAISAALKTAGIPVSTQPVGAIGEWWTAAEVVCAVASLRLTRSTADDSAVRLEAPPCKC